MADSSSVVSTTAWHKIVLVLALLCATGFFVFFAQDSSPTQLYSATDSELDLAVVDGITKADEKAAISSGNTRAVIVPHHLVASEAIALGIKALASTSPRMVVIVSPDHFAKCPRLLCTSQGSYSTFFGNVKISENEVGQLLSHKELVAESGLFSYEHGVYAIVPFIKHYLPGATVVPIAVSQRGVGNEQSRAEAISILDKLVSRKDAALVISTDFSHYLPLAAADENDEHTRSVFCSGDDQALLNLKNPSQSDCPLCLWIARQEAAKNGFWNPVIVWHSNSANLLHNTTAQETTSHFTFLLSDMALEGNCSMGSRRD